MRFVALIVLLAAFSSCNRDHSVQGFPMDSAMELTWPQGFPEMEIPEENGLTQYRVKLGRKLFFDTRLSSDNSVSCASCHIPSRAFADLTPVSEGVDGNTGERNAPSLANSGYQQSLNMDGGVPNLELQVLVPLHDENELNFNNLELVEKLRDDPEINRLSRIAYDREFDTYVITRALASYERTLISGNSRYDQYLRGETSLTEAELNGKSLFFSSETQCSSCHGGFLFSDQAFWNVGLYIDYEDEGRRRVTGDEADIGKFKTPSLRNVAVTDPYMHNGSVGTLAEVLEFFNSGGLDHPNKDVRVEPLNLTPGELADLEAFLETLTDEEFLSNTTFLPD